MKVFVDTSAWVAYFDKKDEFHRKAVEFAKTFPDLITSNIVFHELTAHIENWGSRVQARKVAQILISAKICEFVCLTPEEEIKTVEKYNKTPARISFVDVSNKVVMDSLGLDQIFAFDRDFVRLGLKIVP